MNSIKMIANIFWNAGQNRLRAGWRLSIQFVLFLVVVISLAVFTSIFGSGPVTATSGSLIYLAGGLGVVWLMARFIDRRPYADFGFHLDRRWWLDFGFGSALGAFLLTGIFLSLWAAGWVTITGSAITKDNIPFILAFLLKVIVYASVAVNEELTFRGYQLKNLSEGFAGKRVGPRGAIVLAFLLSSTFFGLAHFGNQNATALSTINIVVSGFALALPFLLTGELGLSIGFHLTWNLFEGTVYGFAVSGSTPTTHLLAIQQSGPDLWTGGAFGPEAGLICIVWLLIGCILTIGWVKWLRNQVGLHLPLATYTPVSTPK
jgi:membrane protease YdiL (CAAX protease family)